MLAWLLPGLKESGLLDGLDSLSVGLRALPHTQFFATKLGEEAQTGPAEYLATSGPLQSYRRDNTLAKHSDSAHSLV